ncbi:MAG TPA: hypothetical protein VGI06_04600, partial [Acidimicrobiales bacterium]
ARATREAATAEAQRLEREVEAARRAAAGAQEAARSRAELEVAEAALTEAVAAEAAADREVAAATASVGAARDELARAGEERAAARTADLPLRDEAGTDQDDEIYVLSRLANSRSVGRFGPVPVLLVEPFSRFGPARSAAVRDLLGRMSSAVQIIYLTEDSDVVTWGRQIGQQRASVLRFGATADLRP